MSVRIGLASRFAVLPIALAVATLAPRSSLAQSIVTTSRVGSSYVACGDIFSGPRASHNYTLPIYTHDVISFSSDGGGYHPISSADITLDTFVTDKVLSFVFEGHSYRGPIPGGGDGSATATASSQDQWSFNITSPTCFSLTGNVEVYLSTGDPTSNQGFQLGVDGGGAAIFLADGSYRGVLSVGIDHTGSATGHFTGMLTPGSYFMTLSGYANGNGNPRTASYSNSVSLTIGPPTVVTNPQPVAICADGTAEFSINPPPPDSSYHWQLQQGSLWLDLEEGVNTINGAPAFDVTGAQQPAISVRSIWGLGGNLRCVVSNDCGSTTTDPAALTILDPADPACSTPPPCNPDVNQDGVADQGDVDYLINVIAGGENPTGIDPDFNQDGVADQGDIDALVDVVAGGPCP
ncbi:MAG: hypothetical protein GC200_04555 [Tepidisphaera sp.]|nr:hypothetical protein [Tepidisphaera sp.]